MDVCVYFVFVYRHDLSILRHLLILCKLKKVKLSLCLTN
jgi:hypothetical protein